MTIEHGFVEIAGTLTFPSEDQLQEWLAHEINDNDVEDLGGFFQDVDDAMGPTVDEVMDSFVTETCRCLTEAASFWIRGLPLDDYYGRISLPIAASILAASGYGATGAVYFLGSDTLQIPLVGTGWPKFGEIEDEAKAVASDAYQQAFDRLSPRDPEDSDPDEPVAVSMLRSEYRPHVKASVALKGTGAPAITFEQLDDAEPRAALSTKRYKKSAPILSDPRLAHRRAPDTLDDLMDANATVFDAPNGGFLVFPKSADGSASSDVVLLDAAGTSVRLDSPPTHFPYSHGFSGNTLFLGYLSQVRRIDLASGASTKLTSVSPSSGACGVAVAQDLVAVVSQATIRFLKAADGTQVESFACRYGHLAEAAFDGRVVVAGAATGSRILGVHGDRVEVLWELSNYVINAAWEENGDLYIHAYPNATDYGFDDRKVFRIGGVEKAWETCVGPDAPARQRPETPAYLAAREAEENAVTDRVTLRCVDAPSHPKLAPGLAAADGLVSSYVMDDGRSLLFFSSPGVETKHGNERCQLRMAWAEADGTVHEIPDFLFIPRGLQSPELSVHPDGEHVHLLHRAHDPSKWWVQFIEVSLETGETRILCDIDDYVEHAVYYGNGSVCARLLKAPAMLLKRKGDKLVPAGRLDSLVVQLVGSRDGRHVVAGTRSDTRVYAVDDGGVSLASKKLPKFRDLRQVADEILGRDEAGFWYALANLPS